MTASGAGDVYTHGHHDSVLRSHRWRTAENSAAYLLPHLRPGDRLLDVGCGPGTLTVDLARHVAPGRVVGIDLVPEVVEQARAHARAQGDRAVGVSFVAGDFRALAPVRATSATPAAGTAAGQPDGPHGSAGSAAGRPGPSPGSDGAGGPGGSGGFDVVHAHQVLQHLRDPVGALRDMARLVRPGGLVAVRDVDYAATVLAPAVPGLARWLDVYLAVTRRNGAEANAGRHLRGWALAAGFAGDDLTCSSSTWTFATAPECAWWADLWAERIVTSTLAEQAVAYGIATRDELASIAEAWRRWGAAPDAVCLHVHGELLVRVGERRP